MARNHKAPGIAAGFAPNNPKSIAKHTVLEKTTDITHEAKTFLALPRELRDQIYEIVCSSPFSQIKLDKHPDHCELFLKDVPNVAFACVNHQIRAEILQTMTGNISLHIYHNHLDDAYPMDFRKPTQTVLDRIGKIFITDFSDVYEIFMEPDLLLHSLPLNNFPILKAIHLCVDLGYQLPERDDALEMLLDLYPWEKNLQAWYRSLAALRHDNAQPVRFYFEVEHYPRAPTEISILSETDFVAGILRIMCEALTYAASLDKSDLEIC